MSTRLPPRRTTCFLNLDLDIEAPYDLAPLVEALEDSSFLLTLAWPEAHGAARTEEEGR